jgi:hypothetical protein
VRGAGLDKTLAPAVAAGLGKPLQEAFRTAFSKQLLPAFESATQDVFQQINMALAAGLQEHVQVGAVRWVEWVEWLGPCICAWCLALAVADGGKCCMPLVDWPGPRPGRHAITITQRARPGQLLAHPCSG